MERKPMRIALLGGTKGMGRAMARLLSARGDRVFLLGRDAEELSRSAADLHVRAGTETPGYAPCDLEDPTSFEPALDAAVAALGGLDVVVVTAGMFATQDTLEDDLALTQRLLTVNFGHTVVFCEHARKRLLADGGGTLCVFSSVAGDRGRKPVVLYGASKAGLSAYLEGLDHRFHDQGLATICFKPGFVRTGMTAGLPEPPFAGDVEPVAAAAVRAIDHATPQVYAPSIWGWVMAVIRRLPRFVMRRVQF
ncbi:MAG: SDR family NAD(P)-dependent oxidoreductase [Myxococcota bacterium]